MALLGKLAMMSAALALLGCKSHGKAAAPAAPTPAAAPDAAPAHASAPTPAPPAPAPADAAVAVRGIPDAGPSAVDSVTSASAVGPGDNAGGPHHDASHVLTIAQPLRGTQADQAPVFVARGDDPDDLVTRAFADLDPKIPAGARVIIKANMAGFDMMHPGKPDNGVTGRITNPKLVRALVLELRRRHVKNISIADGSGDPVRWPKLLALSGYAALSQELGVPIIDLHAGEGDTAPWHVKLPWAKKLKDELDLSDQLVGPKQRPYLIDVPKMKAHRFAVMSLSIKNLMGTVMIGEEGATGALWQRRYRMHRELSPWLDAWKKTKTDDRAAYQQSLVDFSERLADLYGVVTPDLVLIEGLPAMQGDGFAKVIPYGDRGILVASQNGCYADYVAARFFGLADSAELEKEIGARMPPAILAVAKRYYGGLKALKSIVVHGDPLAPPAQAAWFKAMAPFELGQKPVVTR